MLFLCDLADRLSLVLCSFAVQVPVGLSQASFVSDTCVNWSCKALVSCLFPQDVHPVFCVNKMMILTQCLFFILENRKGKRLPYSGKLPYVQAPKGLCLFPTIYV